MADTRNRLPGYELIDELGSDAAGTVWRGRDEATGELVELRRLPGAADLLDRERARRAAATIAGVQHPHLSRTRRLLALPTGIVVVTDAFGGGSLARLLAARGRLSPAEVVTTGGPLAAALAALHEAGLAHGRVTPDAVRFTPDGRPVFADVALDSISALPRHPLPGFAHPGCPQEAAPTPSGDVHDLAAVLVTALTGKAPYAPGAPDPALCAPPSLAHALAAALRAIPEQRCSAGELSAALLACPAEPVRLAGGRAASATLPLVVRSSAPSHRPAGEGGRPQPRRGHVGTHRGGAIALLAHQPTRQRLRRHVPVTVALFTALVLALTIARLLWHDRPPERPVSASPSAEAAAAASPSSAAPTPARAPSAPPAKAPRTGPLSADAGLPHGQADWRAILAGLDERRSRAFAAADPAQLSTVYAPRAPALRRDQALLHQLMARGARARGLHSQVLAARGTDVSDDRAVVSVTDLLEPYAIVGPDARVQQAMPGRGRAQWDVTLLRTASRWRVYDVQRRGEAERDEPEPTSRERADDVVR